MKIPQKYVTAGMKLNKWTIIDIRPGSRVALCKKDKKGKYIFLGWGPNWMVKVD